MSENKELRTESVYVVETARELIEAVRALRGRRGDVAYIVVDSTGPIHVSGVGQYEIQIRKPIEHDDFLKALADEASVKVHWT